MVKNFDLIVFEFTPETIGDHLFSIPLYQRLYSWETEQVEQLLNDLYDSFSKSPEQAYFIGNIVKSTPDKITHRTALIDGQQRMTTLWLFGFVLKKFYALWSEFICFESKLRLDFIARDEDRIFLKNLVGLNDKDFESQKNNTGVNIMMVNAMNTVSLFFERKDVKEHKEDFAKYIYEQTKLVEVTLPDSTDLNKYFEIMNNRGVQLEKHEILKARIIAKISEPERKKYALIWDACAQMNSYLERSFEKIGSSIIKPKITELIKYNFKDINKFISDITTSGNENGKSFLLILDEAENESEEVNKGIKEPIDEQNINENFTPIVNFPTFLLHCYKLLNKDNPNKVSLKDKDLLETINVSIFDNDGAIKFIQEVLILKILFDQYIIKNYKNGINNLWETRILTIDESGIERRKAFEKSTLILAMLNASTSIEHWFTPVLAYLRQTSEIGDESYMKWLENLDNSLAYARLNGADLISTSDSIIKDISNKKLPGKILIESETLSKGTSTERYWFYKLDYCLLKKWTIEKPDFENRETEKWETEIKRFQFRSNRSIEHIFPQHPEDENTNWNDKDLNSFGNLALISISSNSEYNRNEFKWKKLQFEAKIEKKLGIESLKMADIYSRKDWNQEICKEHMDKMIKILFNYHSNSNKIN